MRYTLRDRPTMWLRPLPPAVVVHSRSDAVRALTSFLELSLDGSQLRRQLDTSTRRGSRLAHVRSHEILGGHRIEERLESTQ